MNKKTIIIILGIILVLFISLNIVKVQDIILKNFYPLTYNELIEKYAKEYNVDKWYIYAIIKAESNFDNSANSTSGAKGLMQIMESTSKDIAKSLDLNLYENYDLYDSEINIRFGTKYFADLLKEYKNVNLSLAAYNAGKGNVKKWIEKGTIKEDGSDIENIPFKETNMYVRKILQNYKIYVSIYN